MALYHNYWRIDPENNHRSNWDNRLTPVVLYAILLGVYYLVVVIFFRLRSIKRMYFFVRFVGETNRR